MNKYSAEVLTPEDKRNIRKIEALLETAMEHNEKLTLQPDKPLRKRQEVAHSGGLKQKEHLSRAASASLRQIEARIDRKLVKKNVDLANKLCRLLNQTYPRLEGDAVGEIAGGLSDVWAVGIKHKRALDKILAMGSEGAKRNLDRDLARMEVLLLEELKDDLRHLRRGFYALWRHLKTRRSG